MEIERPSSDQVVETERTDQGQEESEIDNPGELQNYQLTRDRTRRQIKVPTRYAQVEIVYYALSVAKEVGSFEPQSYKEAVTGPDRQKWLKAMDEEMLSFEKNKT